MKDKSLKISEMDLFPEEADPAPARPLPAPSEELFQRLDESDFRHRFQLNAKDRAYISEHGIDTIRRHAEEFIAHRLAPAFIPNDGKQTPMRHVHPVFIAQHHCACCCRGCLEKWHHIPKGRALTAEEQQYVVGVLMTWIQKEIGR
ncbi:MAG: DUF4186 domain-containing protein [Prevotella sp.]|jgi:hypothetical protein|nr:DUF4186 domain-containing protein [Prevotella sp.]